MRTSVLNALAHTAICFADGWPIAIEEAGYGEWLRQIVGIQIRGKSLRTMQIEDVPHLGSYSTSVRFFRSRSMFRWISAYASWATD